MPWLDHHVGIDMYRRISFDTMFAQHTLNEYADLKLERMAVRYTDLGRYDLELLLWKKAHKFDEEDNEGYGKVPDGTVSGILLPHLERRTVRLLPIGPQARRIDAHATFRHPNCGAGLPPNRTETCIKIFLTVYQTAFLRAWQPRCRTNDAPEASPSQRGVAHRIGTAPPD